METREKGELQVAINTFWLGVDPGKSGAAALMDAKTGEITSTIKFSESERDIHQWFLAIDMAHAMLEKVHSMPKQGVRSMFTFGQQYGFCRGMLIAHSFSFREVAPGVWQRSMGCLSGGDKKVTYRKAQELFPYLKITHAIADACLLAEYARQTS